MCRGIFAGSAHKLSMRSAFPAIHQYEAKHGTIIGGAIMTKSGELNNLPSSVNTYIYIQLTRCTLA